MELKEITPYLAYELRGFDIESEGYRDIETVVGIQIVGSKFIIVTDKDEINPETFQLILRPLSDLIKPCLEGGKFPLIELAKMTNDYIIWGTVVSHDKNSSFSVHSIDMKNELWYGWNSFSEISNGNRLVGLKQLDLFQKLFEWHFDVYDLISNGEAIDINALK